MWAGFVDYLVGIAVIGMRIHHANIKLFLVTSMHKF